MPQRFPKIGYKFLRSAEFRARQLWLDFDDAVGTALEVLEPVKESAWAWFRQWKTGFCSKPIPPAKPLQLELPYPLRIGAVKLS